MIEINRTFYLSNTLSMDQTWPTSVNSSLFRSFNFLIKIYLRSNFHRHCLLLPPSRTLESSQYGSNVYILRRSYNLKTLPNILVLKKAFTSAVETSSLSFYVYACTVKTRLCYSCLSLTCCAFGGRILLVFNSLQYSQILA